MSHLTYIQAAISDGGVLLHTRCSTDTRQGGYVAVQPRFVGVCRSDVKELQGVRSVRSDFGHELVGTVLHSRGIDQPRIGVSVALDPHVPLAMRTTAYGTLMELAGSEEALCRALIPLPQVLNQPVGVFVEPLACAIHCVRRARSTLGSVPESADVLGSGTAGLLIAACLSYIGCNVHLLNRTDDRLAFLDCIGVKALGIRLSRPIGPSEAAFVATTTFENGLSMLAAHTPKRLAVVYGGTRPGEKWRSLPIDELRRREMMLRVDSFEVAGSYGATKSDFTAAVELLSTWTHLQSLLARYLVQVVPLSQLPQTLLRLAQRRQLGKVAVSLENP